MVAALALAPQRAQVDTTIHCFAFAALADPLRDLPSLAKDRSGRLSYEIEPLKVTLTRFLDPFLGELALRTLQFVEAVALEAGPMGMVARIGGVAQKLAILGRKAREIAFAEPVSTSFFVSPGPGEKLLRRSVTLRCRSWTLNLPNLRLGRGAGPRRFVRGPRFGPRPIHVPRGGGVGERNLRTGRFRSHGLPIRPRLERSDGFASLAMALLREGPS